MLQTIPSATKAIVLRAARTPTKPTYHDANLETLSIPKLSNGQVLVKINAASYNHRDLWIRKAQYPGTGPGAIVGSDGAGVVVASAHPNDPLLQKRVFLSPMRGWHNDPYEPESEFIVIGGSLKMQLGAFAEYVLVDRDQVITTPEHLSDEGAAALPCGAVTAWRAAIFNGAVKAGDSVLITGIGGGVALFALQICVAQGATVYVTSGSQEKIDKAIKLGARAGFNYKGKWEKELAAVLNKTDKKHLDVVIDSAGGDILDRVTKVLKSGGKIVCYGMTVSTSIPYTMRGVLKQQQILGTTLGSRSDMEAAAAFIAKHRIEPVVSDLLEGLTPENVERGFEILKSGNHFGKVVIRIGGISDAARPEKAKL